MLRPTATPSANSAVGCAHGGLVDVAEIQQFFTLIADIADFDHRKVGAETVRDTKVIVNHEGTAKVRSTPMMS